MSKSYASMDNLPLTSSKESTINNNNNNNYDDVNTNTLQAVITKNDDYLLYNSTTTVIIALDTEIIGAILLEDELRFGSKDAILNIKSMGLHPIMLTGDNENIAKKIAKGCRH